MPKTGLVLTRCDRYGHLVPEVDVSAAAKLEALRTFGLAIAASGQRTMTLPDRLVAELDAHLSRSSGVTYVLATTNGGPLHAEQWRAKYWRPAVLAADLAPLRPHDYADIRVMPTFRKRDRKTSGSQLGGVHL